MTEPRRITCRRCKRLLFKSKEANGVVEAKCEKCGLIAEYELSSILMPTTEAHRGPAVA